MRKVNKKRCASPLSSGSDLSSNESSKSYNKRRWSSKIQWCDIDITLSLRHKNCTSPIFWKTLLFSDMTIVSCPSNFSSYLYLRIAFSILRTISYSSFFCSFRLAEQLVAHFRIISNCSQHLNCFLASNLNFDEIALVFVGILNC